MKYVLAIFGVLVIIGIAVAVLWKNSDAPQTTPIKNSIPAEDTGRKLPEGFLEYRTERYGFSLLYPADLTVSHIPEGGQASTIVFQNPDRGLGFQIFIVPYTEPTVSEERVKEDIPTGVREDLSDITVDGAIGASFHSTDLSLGETSEVWFINNGFLYEVTTLRQLEKELKAMIQSWKFL